MLHFKKGLGWKACYDDEKNLYTAKTSWRGDFHLYEINAENTISSVSQMWILMS